MKRVLAGVVLEMVLEVDAYSKFTCLLDLFGFSSDAASLSTRRFFGVVVGDIYTHL